MAYLNNTSPFQGYITNAIAINPETNKVYIALQSVSTPGSAGLIAVLNGTTYNGSTSEVATIIQDISSDAYQPYAIAVDPVTNVIYVANTGGGSGNGSVTVIDGATDAYVGTISDPGSTPEAIVVNSATNTVYLANNVGNSVTVCSGATRSGSGPVTNGSCSATTIAVGSKPIAMALNPASGMLFVANSGSTGTGNVSVINTATNMVTFTVNDSNVMNPIGIAVDASSSGGYVYVANGSLGTAFQANNPSVIEAVTAINSADYTSSTLTDSSANAQKNPTSIAVNPVTHRVYVSARGNGQGSVSVFQGTSWFTTEAFNSSVNGVAVDTSTDTVFAVTVDSGIYVMIGQSDGFAITPLPTGAGLQVPAVNPITHKAYVAIDSGSANPALAVVDEAPNSSATITPSSASLPFAIAVNPATNIIFVANNYTSTVSIINGSTNSLITTAPTGANPVAIVVDPVNNLIYTANSGGENLTIIDGSTINIAMPGPPTTYTVTLNPTVKPDSLAYNPVLNEVYGAASEQSMSFQFASSATNQNVAAYSYVFGGSDPVAVATNPASGMAFNLLTSGTYDPYLTIEDAAAPSGYYGDVCMGSTPITMDVNTATNSVFVVCTNTVNVVQGPSGFTGGNETVITPSNEVTPVLDAVAVNSITNLAYVADTANNCIYVINVADENPVTNTISVGVDPVSIAINIASNKVYVLSAGGSTAPSITIIDGATNTILGTIPVGSTGQVNTLTNEIAANPVTGNIYAIALSGNTVTAITENVLTTPPAAIQTTINPLTNNTTYTSAPTFTFSATNTFDAATVTGVYFQVDSMQGTWTSAVSIGDGYFSGTASNITPGFHMLYAFATEGDDADSSSFTGLLASPLVGPVASYGFLVAPPIAEVQPNVLFGTVAQGSSGSAQNVYLANEGGAAMNYGSYVIGGDFSDDFVVNPSASTCSAGGGTIQAESYCLLAVSFTPSTQENETATLTFTDNSLGVDGSTQMVPFSGTGVAPTTELLTITGSGTGNGYVTDGASLLCYITAGVTSGTCTMNYNSGATVNLTAQATGYSTFSTWGGACYMLGSTNPCTLQMTGPYNVSATFSSTPPPSYTLSVSEFGTGTGAVTDGTTALDCTETGGTVYPPCSNTYSTPTVTLTEIPQPGTTFIGWGGACSGTATTCLVTMSSNMNVTADFIPAPTPVPLTFVTSPGPESMQATYNCPGNPNPTPSNPCNAPFAYALNLGVQSVSSQFTVNVLATEVPPSLADGICESNTDMTQASVQNDFDCRFFNFFNYGTDTVTGGAIVPRCVPIANGNCVHYLVYGSAPGDEPPTTSYVGPVNWKTTWNDDAATTTSPGPYWLLSTPQLYDDPDSAPTPTSAVGTSCTSLMTIGGVNQSYYCQFEFNITTFYDASEPVDNGIGGSTKAFNDVVVAWPPTSTPANTTLPLLNGSSTTTPTNGTASYGTGIGFTVTLTNKGATTASGITLNDPLPAGATWTLGSSSISGCGISGSSPQVLSCSSLPSGFSLAPSASAIFTVTSSNALAGVYTNVATFTIGTQQTLTVATVTVQGLTSAFSGLSSYIITYGQSTQTISGTISAGSSHPPAGESVMVTIGSTTKPATITGTSGAFSVAFPTSTIPASSTPYPITYSYTSDGNFSSVTNSTSSTLTVNKTTSTTTITTVTPSPSTVGAPVAVTVKVTGSGTPTGSVTVTAKLSSTSVTCPITLASGTGTCSVTLSTAGAWTITAAYGGDSNFNSSSTATGTPQTVNAAGSTLKFSPSTLNFGTLYPGSTALATSTVTNTGTSMVTFTSFSVMAISGDDSTGFLGVELCPKTLNGGKSCVIIMSFTADSNVTKTHAANLLIADNASGSPQTIPMTATVINPQASLSASSLNFGNQKTGTTSTAKTITVTNTGTTTLAFSGLSISGNFAIASNGTTCKSTTSLAPTTGKCTINVTFTPTAKGSKTGTLKITDNAKNSPQSVSLSGNGD